VAQTWAAAQRGLGRSISPTRMGGAHPREVGHCVPPNWMHPPRRVCCYAKKANWDVHWRSGTNEGDSCKRSRRNLAETDFGFSRSKFMRMSRRTIYVVPGIQEGIEHTIWRLGKLRVTESARRKRVEAFTGKVGARATGTSNVLRNAVTSNSLVPCGIYFGTTGEAGYASPAREIPVGSISFGSFPRFSRRGAETFHDPGRAPKTPFPDACVFCVDVGGGTLASKGFGDKQLLRAGRNWKPGIRCCCGTIPANQVHRGVGHKRAGPSWRFFRLRRRDLSHDSARRSAGPTLVASGRPPPEGPFSLLGLLRADRFIKNAIYSLPDFLPRSEKALLST